MLFREISIEERSKMMTRWEQEHLKFIKDHYIINLSIIHYLDDCGDSLRARAGLQEPVFQKNDYTFHE